MSKCVRLVLTNGDIVVGKVLREDNKAIELAVKWVVPVVTLDRAVRLGERITLDNANGVVVDVIDGAVLVETKQIVSKSVIKEVTVYKHCH